MKRILIITGLVILLIALIWNMAFANTSLTFLRIGRLWMIQEFDGAEGWGGQCSWPGGYPISAYSSTRQLWDANMRKLGTVAGCKDWTGPNGVNYPYWTSGMYRTYHYEYLEYWMPWTDLTQNFPVTQKEIQRWAPPNVIVNGVNIIPDGGDNYLQIHDNAEIDPSLVTERCVESIWDYSMGVTYTRRAYAYSNRKHQDYILWHLNFKNTGRMHKTPTVLSDQTINDFFWAQTGNPWNSRAGRDFSYGQGKDDEVGEFITPFADERRFYLFYDGDNPNSAERDWADPSKDSRWIRLLSPAWIVYGALRADKSATDESTDLTQPKALKIGHERNYDLGKKVGTMQEQYEMLFEKDGTYSDWPLDTPHRDVEAAITRPSGYTGFGPYTMGPGEDFNLDFVWAAGGLSMAECRRLGAEVQKTNCTGPILDEVEQLFKTGRDSVMKTMALAEWNINGSKPSGRSKYDVPDAPRPPANFSVRSDGPQIALEWTDESETEPDFDTQTNDFAGYRIYKAIGARDSVYHVIYDGTNRSYVDTDVAPGFQYFYYLIAYDDGSQNWEDPGVSLESGRFYCWTGWAPEGIQPAVAPVTVEAALDDIRVVPNPYSASGKTFPGELDKILFTGLPAKCTITIFTTNGDFVHEIEHTDGSGNEAWDLRTEFNQYIVSDVYIYTVKSDIGDHVGKFIVIR